MSSRLGGAGLDTVPLPPNHIQAAVERPLYDVKLPTCSSEEPKISSREVKKLTPERVGELYDNEDLGLALTTTIKVIAALTEQTRCLERAMLKKARLREEFKLLLTVWGIGEILGLTILYEASDMNRFASPGNFASYCRCVDATRLSNGKKKAGNNAKNGNKYLAWAFVEAAHSRSATTRKRNASTTAKQQDQAGRRHQGHRPQTCSRLVLRAP